MIVIIKVTRVISRFESLVRFALTLRCLADRPVLIKRPSPLVLFQEDDSVLKDGACQIPDPLYKLIGSIICFYIPLGVMLLTYALTVRLLAEQQQNIGGTRAGWSSGWLGASQGAATATG